MRKYYPKRPVKSFQDLQVYQILYNNSVEIIKRVSADTNQKTVKSEVKNSIITKLFAIVSEIPVQIATAHSIRFSEQQKALLVLEKVMLNCNLSAVYLEQYRDLCNQNIETEFFDELIKSYLATRGKVFRLQRAWKKFMEKK